MLCRSSDVIAPPPGHRLPYSIPKKGAQPGSPKATRRQAAFQSASHWHWRSAMCVAGETSAVNALGFARVHRVLLCFLDYVLRACVIDTVVVIDNWDALFMQHHFMHSRLFNAFYIAHDTTWNGFPRGQRFLEIWKSNS